jgi:cell wall-associated NlpC family hydrolase
VRLYVRLGTTTVVLVSLNARNPGQRNSGNDYRERDGAHQVTGARKDAVSHSNKAVDHDVHAVMPLARRRSGQHFARCAAIVARGGQALTVAKMARLVRMGMISLFAGLVVLLCSGPVGADDGLSTGLGLPGDTTGLITAPDIYPDPTMATPDLGVSTIDASTLAIQDGLDLAQSSVPLSQVDLSTGSIAGPDINTTLSSDATTTLALAGVGALAIDATALTAQAAQQQAAQQAQSSSGCPTSAPPNTMRDGAPDIATLCANSVAAARSSQAAAAIKWALSNLGVPYSQPLRNEVGYFDCSSFVSRAYQAAGVPIAPPGVNAPTTYTIANAPWAIHESLSAALPGDLVEPDSGHVVMLLSGGFVAQASMPGDVTNVTALWTSEPYLVVWIDPANA